jgi:hypothetical protein
VAVMAAAIDKVARSEDFKKYLADELAFADSFIPTAQTGAFFEREFKTIEASIPKKN